MAAGGVGWVGNGRDSDISVRAGVKREIAAVRRLGTEEGELKFGEGWRVNWGGEVG